MSAGSTAVPFDPQTSPLRGTIVVEASAGSGKTHALAETYVRLVRDEGVKVGEILVVTFTEAAAADLRSRIRKNLGEALAATPWGVEIGGQRLGEALRSFDLAAIYTIHGFSSHALRENAFETGLPFDTELDPHIETAVAQVVDDFWRRILADSTPAFIAHLRKNPRGRLRSILAALRNAPDAIVLPDDVGPPRPTGAAEDAFRAAFEDLRRLWAPHRDEVERLLVSGKRLDARTYRKDYVTKRVAAMSRYAAGPPVRPPEQLKYFLHEKLASCLKDGAVLPRHLALDACDKLSASRSSLDQAFSARWLALQVQFARTAPAELLRFNAKRNVLGFDDLIERLLEALRSPRGPRLVERLRLRYRAALIDEFQDTDRRQYEIFRTIFASSPGLLLLIGDPKQSIYTFRGADVLAYLSAARQASRQYTLTQNWRSEPRLVAGVNHLFAALTNPFEHEGIRFEPAVPAAPERTEVLTVDGEPAAPFQIRVVRRSEAEKGKLLSVGNGEIRVAQSTAAEVASLLALGSSGRARIGKKPLRPENVAVLVRTNRQASGIEKELRRAGIPSSLEGGASVFASDEARELETIFLALAAPRRESSVRAALATSVFGWSATKIAALDAGGSDLDHYLDQFDRWSGLWLRSSVMAALSALWRDERVRERLVGFIDGERRITNLLHLGELLHQEERTRGGGAHGLLRWLASRRADPPPNSDEEELRLESDGGTVAIRTAHRSKGLEFPVVFCPFLWKSTEESKRSDSVRLSPSPDGGSPPTLILDTIHAGGESRAEEMRLAYVALTRAKSRVYVYTGALSGVETSVAGRLLGVEQVGDLEDNAILERVAALGPASGGAIAAAMALAAAPATEIAARGPAGTLEPQRFRRELDTEWRFTSFSALTHDEERTAELADRDPPPTPASLPVAALPEPSGLAGPNGVRKTFRSFPQGTDAGTFIHEVLEHADFASPRGPAEVERARRALKTHGFDPTWIDSVLDLLDQLSRVALLPSVPELELRRVGRRERASELEFLLPLRPITASGLAAVLHGAAGSDTRLEMAAAADGLRFSPARGFLRGFIDLVVAHRGRYYLVDWKSNFLGPDAGDYAEEALAAAMTREHYSLQYLLYAVALDRHFAARLPGYSYEEHFGGVFYVFLRGIDAARPGAGVYHARPSTEIIAALSAYLLEPPTPGGTGA